MARTRISLLLRILQGEPPVRRERPTVEADDSSGARAIEVVAMLGDSVVGVKHCIDPKGGKVQPTTWALIAVGVASLIAFGFAFWTAVDNAADNQDRYDYETSVLGKPGFSVRPWRLPGAYDWIAFGGLFASIVTCTTALARMRKERQSSFVRIGTAPGVEFPVADAPAPDFPMVAPQGDDFAFRFGHGMEGEILVGGNATSLAELAEQGTTTISPIPANAKIRVRTGGTTFLVSPVARPRRHAMPVLAVDGAFATSLGCTTVAFVIGLLLLFQMPVEDSGASVDVVSFEETTTHWRTAEHDVPPPEIDQDRDDRAEESGGSGRTMAFDRGMMGTRSSNRADAQLRFDRQRQEDPQLARQQAIEAARSAGVLGSPRLVTGAAFASLKGTFDISRGFEDTDIYCGMSESCHMIDNFGFAGSSFGPGGGGTGWGRIVAGNYRTTGHGERTGSGYGVGGGSCHIVTCRGRDLVTPTVMIGQPTAQGDLDKAIIRRYVKRNIDKITYCYEKQLLAKPGLSGTVVTQFFITPSGTVASATSAGVDVEVANCVADVIKGIEFPRPTGGGGVQVNYPFTFRPTSQ